MRKRRRRDIWTQKLHAWNPDPTQLFSPAQRKEQRGEQDVASPPKDAQSTETSPSEDEIPAEPWSGEKGVSREI